MAELAVATLRKVFEVPRPVVLVYRAFSRDGEEILLSTLGVERHARRARLNGRIDAALQDYLEIDEVLRDEDGDRPVRSGDGMVEVRVIAGPGFVAVFSPALLGVTRNAALVEAVNDITRGRRPPRPALASDVVGEATQLPHWREVYVGIPYGDGVLEGYIDLLYRAPEGLVVVDHKTDRWRGEADLQDKVERYRVQLEAYGRAVGEAAGEMVAGLVLLFLNTGGTARAVLT
jgi:hypothetical protein